MAALSNQIMTLNVLIVHCHLHRTSWTLQWIIPPQTSLHSLLSMALTSESFVVPLAHST